MAILRRPSTTARDEAASVDPNIETADIDRRYERCRLKHVQAEQRLLAQIAQVGVREALLGTQIDGRYVLLDGFKRLRCASRLGLPSVPFRSLGSDEATAIIALMRQTSSRGLTLVEQAWLIDELRGRHGLSVVEIARRLEKSPAWVSARLGLSTELSPAVAEKIATGAFPTHAYLSSIRPLTRVTGAPSGEIEAFVCATSDKGLSVRDLGVLANAYFTGSDDFKRHVTEGDVRWCLDALRAKSESRAPNGANGPERMVLRDLDLVTSVAKRLRSRLGSEDVQSAGFRAEAHRASGRLLSLLPSLTRAIEDFHARSRPEESDRDALRQGDEQARDRACARGEPQHRA